MYLLDNTCRAGGAQRNVGRPGKMTKSGKNESFCEGMAKALITKMTKSGKNGPFCEGMVKALFSKKSQKSVQKSAQIGVNLAVTWLPKSGLNALFFQGFSEP